MNNLNEPPRWNIQPNPRERGVGGEDGNRWNYALLLPLLGLAAFREFYRRKLHRTPTLRLICSKSKNSVSSPFCITLSISGWIWTKESQKEVQEVKAKYDQDLSTIKSEMEASYRGTLTERCKAVATLELELEKERQRVEGYRRAMASHSQLLMEGRKSYSW
ncbi:unnamed protein product [Tetraodon nigroviridis]|uniref:(spotted green pufferfish) hypothetical protein n=1 Tax=Tetraodon nigroviridis TaxID=99883 RepID=Q4RFG6_TETNG|nr:unnamed protein product [Tetraodon nigroviridis]